MGFPCGSGSVPGLGRSPGGRHGNPFQYCCRENPHEQRSLAGYSPWGCKEWASHDWVTKHSTQRIHIYILFMLKNFKQKSEQKSVIFIVYCITNHFKIQCLLSDNSLYFYYCIFYLKNLFIFKWRIIVLVFVSAIYQQDSAIGVHMFTPSRKMVLNEPIWICRVAMKMQTYLWTQLGGKGRGWNELKEYQHLVL